MCMWAWRLREVPPAIPLQAGEGAAPPCAHSPSPASGSLLHWSPGGGRVWDWFRSLAVSFAGASSGASTVSVSRVLHRSTANNGPKRQAPVASLIPRLTGAR